MRLRDVTIAALLVLAAALGTSAQQGASKSDPATSTKVAPRKSLLDDTARESALAFARDHHPELAGLLKQLRTRNEREFDRAARQIVMTADRLAKMKDRDPVRYEIQLDTWKLDSRIKLLAARLSMGEDPALEEQLEELVVERLDVRVRQLRHDREQLEQRLKSTTASIDRIETDREKAVERELKRIHATLQTMPQRNRPKTVETKRVDTKKTVD